jgi:two-component system chemotaxis response regulator CheB
MKKMNSQFGHTKKNGHEFIATIKPGEVFISFHHANEACIGFYVAKEDFTIVVFEKTFKKVSNFFAGDLKSVELKIIGMPKVIEQAAHYFSTFHFGSIKKIEKAGVVEVIFFPASNKVRVSIEPVSGIFGEALKTENIKVLIVDDSKTIRNILSRIFSSDERFTVCAMAEKPSDVDALIQKHRPDVITLDIHMPEMDGVSLLKIISPKYHIPTVMISSISMAEGPMVLEALENGAIDYIQKPELSEIGSVTPVILEKVKIAAMSNINKRERKKVEKVIQTKEICQLDSLIVLGSSTGGTEAIREILTALPNEIPPMLIVQHIPAIFSLAFAKRMNDLCPFEVKEARDGDEVRKNRVLIAPGGQQMKMVRSGNKTFVEINDDDPVNRFKPSVDYLFFSVAKALYTHTVAVILTGMGKDGAHGMLELKSMGVRTISQDEATSVVFGMPKEAINLGGAEFIEPLSQIAERIALLTSQKNLPLKK